MINQLKMFFRILPPTTSRRRIFFVFLFILASSWLEALGVGIIFPLVKVIAEPESVQTVGLLSTIHQALGKPDHGTFLQMLTAGVLMVFVVKNAFFLFMMNYSLRIVKESEASLCAELLQGYLDAPWADHVERNSGNLIHSILLAPRQIHVSVLWPAIEVVVEIFTLIMIGILLFIADPTMTFAAASFVLAALLVFLRFIPPRKAVLGAETVRIGKLSLVSIQQALGGVKEAKVLGRERFFWKIFATQADRRAVVERHQKLFQTVARPIAETVLMAGMLTAILLVLSADRPASDIIATLSLFAVAAIRLLTSFNRMASGIAVIRNSLPMVDEVYDDVMTYRAAGVPREPFNRGDPLPIRKELILDKVGFSYPRREEEILKDISLTIRRGESVALVGSSGAGKTTLADIILGLLDPKDGRILIDGADATERRTKHQNLFGYVPQSIYLIDDDLRANIAFGVEPEQIDDQALAEAVSLACIEDLVDRLPDGLNTIIGEAGVRLSGGERQRLGIARALYHKPDFIVFDEATSALDNVTERKFSQALRDLHGQRTVIFIAHRLSTIEHCDKIVYLEKGMMIGLGTYAELMENCAPFRRMATAPQVETRGERAGDD
ncbi:MAG: ABC transporter ATP-binding protein [Pseudomonadota bacterium]|nr:ABC transporter ATP-binding protein [Pseudomonadota bacterium]